MNKKPNNTFHQNKKTTDIINIFGIKDFIDRRESEANCLLCFTTFPLYEIEAHIESDYHKILHKVTDYIDNIQEGNLNEGFSSSKKTDQPISGNEVFWFGEPNKPMEKIPSMSVDESNKPNENILYMSKDVSNKPMGKIPSMSKDESNKTKENIPSMSKDDSYKSEEKIKKDGMPKKIFLDDFMETCTYVKVEGTWGFLFNEKIFVEHSSFYFFEQRCNHMFCLRCDKKCSNQHHCFDAYAKFILMKMENEFIRELKPNKFHCGHCNLIKFGWEKMKIHLSTKEHDQKRALSRMMTYMVNNNIGDIELSFTVNGSNMSNMPFFF